MKNIKFRLIFLYLFSAIFMIFMISFNSNDVSAQGIQCGNIFPLPIGNVGVQTQAPQRPLNIHGDTGCVEVTERFSYGNSVVNPTYKGHLLLLTPSTVNSLYTQCWDKGIGDMVLNSEKGQEAGGNIILSVHDSTKMIILATTCPPVPNQANNRELERIKVLPIGRTEFNVGAWNWGLPKIALASTGINPSIRFYQSDGTQPANEYGSAFPWYIQTEDHTMNFKWGDLATIGSESVTTKVIFKMIPPDANIRVGINTTNPLAMLHGTGGSVLFNGTTGLTPTSGAGTRFMWIASKPALRAGLVTGTQWDDANIGGRSVAFGYDCKATALNSFAAGLECEANGWNSVALGQQCLAGDHSQIFENAFAIGASAKAQNLQTCAFGFGAEATGETSTAMGSNVNTNNKRGSFIIGDNIDQDTDGDIPAGDNAGRSTNINQMTMRFNGTENDTSASDKVFRFITASDYNYNIIYEAFLAGNSNGLILTSDRNKKRDITPVKITDVLERLRKVPINTWKWKPHQIKKDSVIITDSLSNTNMGPMAQDFFKQFPIGFPDSTALSTSVMDAVMFASIQALANDSDSLKTAKEVQTNKLNDLTDKIESALTKDEFEKFKDTVNCYRDACRRIEELESRLIELQSIVDSIRNQGTPIFIVKNTSDTPLSSFAFDDIILEQNSPNPFSETSQINYYIPAKYTGYTRLIISDEGGNEIIQQFETCIGKPCQITISAKTWQTGVYIYGIENNGKMVKSNKMMIIK